MGRWRGSGRDAIEETTRITIDDLRTWGYLISELYFPGILIVVGGSGLYPAAAPAKLDNKN